MSAKEKAALESDGILHYSLTEFVAMLVELSNSLEVLSPQEAYLRDLGRSFDEAGMYALSLIASGGIYEQQQFPPQPENSEESKKIVFLPRSVEFLRRIFRAARKQRCLGTTFTDEVIVEIFNGQRKEEVWWGGVCARAA